MNNFDCLNTIDGEILKGINIIQKKINLRPISNNINDIDVGEPSCSNTSRWHNLESNHERDFSTGFGFTSNYKGTVYRKHNIRDHTVIRKTRKKILSQRTKTRCPMRIMQLSVPTKRYCLETWRSNRDILPDFMVERLRRIVMDEKPIVKIYDAINCFKRQKSSKSRLKTLSQVVNEDITSILYNPKKSELNTNIKIQTEIADAASRKSL
nr:uncharacterized protein LOC113401966 isoform X2 [Vanessa tameamea]